MTRHEIYDKYDNLIASDINESVHKYLFKDKPNKYFKNPYLYDAICRMRIKGCSYAEIGQSVHRAPSSVREACVKMIRTYNSCIRSDERNEMKNAKLSNYDVFKSLGEFHDVNIKRLAKSISIIPREIFNTENKDECEQSLIKWFYSEAEENFEDL